MGAIRAQSPLKRVAGADEIARAMLDHPVAAELLFRVNGRGYALARSADNITVAEVLEAARGETPASEPGSMSTPPGKSHAARVEALGTTTLADPASEEHAKAS